MTNEKAMMDKCASIMLIKQGFPHALFYSIVLIIYCPIVVILNTVLIIAFIATKEAVKNTSNLLIICICFIDLLNGAAIMPLFVYILNNIDRKDICMAIKVMFVAGGTLRNSSGILTTLLAIDRFLHMNPNIQNRPSLLRRVFKSSNIGYIITMVVIVSMTVSSLSTILPTSQSGMMVILGPVVVFSMATYVSIVTGLYIKGYKRIRTFTDENPVYHETGEQPNYIKSLYKTVLVLVVLVSVSYLPYCLAQGIGYIFVITKETLTSAVPTYFIEISSLILYSSYFTNCFVVLYFNKKAGSWVSKVFRTCKHVDGMQ